MTNAEFMEAGWPKLLPRARLRYDEVRGRHILLLPERAVVLSDTAAEILRLCDGGRTGVEIIQTLQGKYPGAELQGDVVEFLGAAVKKRWVEWLLPP